MQVMSESDHLFFKYVTKFGVAAQEYTSFVPLGPVPAAAGGQQWSVRARGEVCGCTARSPATPNFPVPV